MKLTLRSSMCILAAAAVVALGVVPAAGEPIPLEFAFGGSDTAPVTDQVDAYVGFGGTEPTTPCLGWASPWQKKTSTASMVETVMNTDPLYTGGGNYLNSVITSSGTNGRGSVGRGYKYDATTNPDGWDVATDHKIVFRYRVDEDLSTFDDGVYDAFQIFDYPGVVSNTGAECRWTVSVNAVSDGQGGYVPGNWYAQDWTTGTQVNVDTGILLQSGVVYDYEVTVRNVVGYTKMRWDLKLSNGTTSFDSTTTLPDGMGFRSSGATPGGYVNFSARANPGGTQRSFSIDSLRIIPEPSSLAMLLALATLGVMFRRGR